MNESEESLIYYKLINMILSTKSKSNTQQIISHMNKYNIHPDTHININGKMCPLINICITQENYYSVILYLISKGVNLNTTYDTEVLIQCNIEYIPILVENGSKLNEHMIIKNCRELLKRGNIDKVMNLLKFNAITKEHLKSILLDETFPFIILDTLYDKMVQFSLQVNTEEQFFNIYNKLMECYINTFKLFILNGFNFGVIYNEINFFQHVLNTYFVELIEYIIDSCPEHVLELTEFYHYSNFNLNNRHMMKYIYTEENYRKIKEIYKKYKIPNIIIKSKKRITKKIKK